MQLHELQRKTPNRKARRVGRGGKRGKTSGRGHKGQKARAGGSPRPELRDIIKKIPKLRGHGKNRGRTVNSGKVKPEVVNLHNLETTFEDGATITPAALLEKGLVRRQHGRTPVVKILGQGDVTKKYTITGCEVSSSAREKLENGGSTIA